MSRVRTDGARAFESEDGFSLAELLTAFAVLGLVLLGLTALHKAAQDRYIADATQTAVDQSARIALDRLATEIRQAAAPCGAGVPITAITAAAGNSITFCDTTGAATTYTLTAGALTRNGVVVVGGVRALTFAYSDAGGNALAAPVGTPANIRRVDITVQTQSENTLIAGTGSAYDVRSQITTSARLRNL